jgi:lantibiotic leader peptide-processing serine protease
MRKFLACGLVLLATAVAAPAAFGSNYVVLYKQSLSANATSSIQKAGGTVVQAWPQIGVVIARSDSSSFRANMLQDNNVENVSSTAGFGVQTDPVESQAAGPPGGDLTNVPATDSTEPLFGLQWDMRQMDTPDAHAVTGGSPSVVVGDLDTGLDFTHPDLAPNYDAADSADCVTGSPAPLDPGNDQAGHGTHTAGTIAAAANGVGIVGVAPSVKIAGVKSGNDAGFFFPEAVICGFMWSAQHHLNVTNNSYFADPWLFNCKNDPTQRGIWAAEARAIRYAIQQGVVVVSAAGNEADDLGHPTQDVTSPDDTTPETRVIHNNCAVIPVEVPGVIGVSATGVFRRKSFYSSYGNPAVEVAAPGGDSQQLSADAPNGRVLSTWPSYLPCARKVVDGAAVYCYLQGTSMASPHVAGLAALVVSQFGKPTGGGGASMSPGQVASFIQQTADPTACPTDYTPYAFFPSVSNGAPQQCTGGAGHNNWYGAGIVNAFSAVTHNS